MMNYRLIIVHPGVFHADDALAVAILFFVVGRRLPVERRNPTDEELDDPEVIVVDVGGRFDVRTRCFDHHQRDFALERDPSEGVGIEGIDNPFAAAGLVWHNFPVMASLKGDYTQEEQTAWWCRVDSMLIRGVDATDCGKAPTPPTGAPASLSAAIHWLNPIGSVDAQERDEAFAGAVEIAGNILFGAVQTAKAWIDGRRVVNEARTVRVGTKTMYSPAASVLPGYNGDHVDQHALVLDEYVPWQEHVFNRTDQWTILYVIFPSERGGFMVQQMPKEPDSFEGRKPLPEAWAGLRGEELAAVNGIEDSIFCHPGRFCGSAETLESAIKMAKLAAAS
jgi:uncharacterized UPF0160 family protein